MVGTIDVHLSKRNGMDDTVDGTAFKTGSKYIKKRQNTLRI